MIKTSSKLLKEVTINNKSIQAPLDFDSLHNIEEFGKTYKQVISFIDNIKKFQEQYLENMMKSKDELLQYIPEKQLSQYHVYLQHHKLCPWDKFAIDLVQKVVVDRFANQRKKYREQGIELVGLIHPTRDKIFLIDTVNKRIYLCLWYRHNYRETIHGWLYDHHCTLEYDRNYIFEILPEKYDRDSNGKYFTHDEDVFRVRVNLSSNKIIPHDTYAKWVTEGGYRFDLLNSYGRSGQEVYDFCMKTNTFKEYNRFR